MSPVIRRLSFERGDSVAAILYNRDTERILLTEQFCYPTYRKGHGWMTEAVAEIIQPDETPEAALRREVFEQTGYEIDRIDPITSFYPSPGGSSERIFLYYAEVLCSGKTGTGGGVSAEGEDIRVVEYSLDGLRQALMHMQIKDAKTLMGVMWFLSHRP